MSQLMSRWLDWVSLHPLNVLTAIFFVTLLAAFYGVKSFSINASFDGLIIPSEDNRWYTDNEAYKKAFPAYQSNTIVAVSAVSAKEAYLAGKKLNEAFAASGLFTEVFAPQYDSFFDTHALYNAPTEGVKRLSEETLAQLPYYRYLDANPDVEYLLGFYARQLIKDSELGLLSEQSRHYLDTLIQALQGDDQVNLGFLAPLYPRDSMPVHYQLIFIKTDQTLNQQLPNAEIISNLQTIFQAQNFASSVRVSLTGEIPLSHEEMLAATEGVELAGIISLVILLLALIIGLRYKELIAGVFLMLGIGIVLTIAVGTFVVGDFNTLSLIFLVMFFGLSVDFAVHFCLSWLDEGRSSASAFSSIGSALFLCTLSTCIAFLSFLPTDYLGLAQLGIVSAIGMSIAFLLTVTFLPAWLSLFHQKTGRTPLNLSALSFDFTKPKALLVLSAAFVFVVFSLIIGRGATFDYSVLAMQDKKAEAVSTLIELQQAQQFNDYSIAVMVDDSHDLKTLIADLLVLDEVASVIQPEAIIPPFQQLKALHLEPVRQALSEASSEIKSLVIQPMSLEAFTLLTARLKPQFFDEDQPLFEALAAAQSPPAANTVLDQSALRGIKQDINKLHTLFFAEPFTLQDLPEGMQARFFTKLGQTLLQVLPAKDLHNREAMTAFIEAVQAVAPNVSGRSVVEWGVGQTVSDAFVEATLYSFGAIFILLVLAFRSLLWPILALLPIALTALFIFMVVSLTSMSLNMANILVVPLIVGLGVDTSLHVIHRYRQRLAGQSDKLSSTHRAVLISALTTLGTFFSLSFSPHLGAASIGMLLSLSIAFLVLVTFLVLPALFSLMSK